MRFRYYGLWKWAAAVISTMTAWLLLTGVGLTAQQGAVEPRFDRSPLPYLFAVYAVTWLAFFGYAFYMTKRQGELRRQIEELRRGLEEKKG